MQTSRSEFHDIRGLRYHVRLWGEPKDPPLFLFHGWMDSSASFQFVVDSLRERWCVIAPDWRGFGLTARAHEGYWFPDYYADLDTLLAASPDWPAGWVRLGQCRYMTRWTVIEQERQKAAAGLDVTETTVQVPIHVESPVGIPEIGVDPV